MATSSSRNFSNYSGIDRQQQMQSMPSTLERLNNPQQFGPGTTADRLLKQNYSWSLPLSERPATAVGRSWYDPARQAERLVRGTDRPGQLQGAMYVQAFQPPQDEIDAAVGLQPELSPQAPRYGLTHNLGNPGGYGPLRNSPRYNAQRSVYGAAGMGNGLGMGTRGGGYGY